MDTTKHTGDIEVLIVEDEIDICYLLQGIFKKQHVQADYATSLFDAQKALQRSHPNVLFIDNHLPDGYGVDFISLVKKEYPSTKIVMMTAQDSGADEDKAFKEGADFFIAKPFTKATILNTLHAVMEESGTNLLLRL